MHSKAYSPLAQLGIELLSMIASQDATIPTNSRRETDMITKGKRK